MSSYRKHNLTVKKRKIKKINTSQSVVDVSEFDHGEPFKSVINSFLTVLALMMVFGAAARQWGVKMSQYCVYNNFVNFFSESDLGELFKSTILPVLMVLALVLVFGTYMIYMIYKKWRKRRSGRTKPKWMIISLFSFDIIPDFYE